MIQGESKLQDVVTRPESKGGFPDDHLATIGRQVAAKYGYNILSRTVSEALEVRSKSESTRRRHFPKGLFLFGMGFTNPDQMAPSEEGQTSMFGLTLVEGGGPLENGAFSRALVRSWINPAMFQDADRPAVRSAYHGIALSTLRPVNTQGHGNGKLPVDELSMIEFEPWIDRFRGKDRLFFPYGEWQDGRKVIEQGLDAATTSAMCRAIHEQYQDRLRQQYEQEIAAEAEAI